MKSASPNDRNDPYVHVKKRLLWCGTLCRNEEKYFSKAKWICLQIIIKLRQMASIFNQNILEKIGRWMSEESGWRIVLVDNHYLNVIVTKVGKRSSASDGVMSDRYLNTQQVHPEKFRTTDKAFV